MTTSLEDRLRSVLAAEAERSPSFPVRAARPVPLLRRRSIRLGMAAGVVATLALALTLAPAGSSGRALAGWTSVPAPADAAVTAALARACGIEHPLIVDVRGHAGYVVGTSHGGASDCLAQVPGEPADDHLRDVELSGQPSAVVSTPSSEYPLVVLAAKSPEGNDVHQHNVTWASGLVGPSVARVQVATAAGSVTATLTDGRFAAWWPGNDGDTAVVRAYDTAGVLLATVDQLSCDSDGRFSPRMTAPDGTRTGGCLP